MKHLFGFNTKKTKAVVNGSGLIVFFGNASPPLVWRNDLGTQPNFSIVIRKGEADWEMGMVGVNGVFSSMAKFDLLDDAEQALNVVQRALTMRRFATAWRVAKIIGILLILAILWQFAGRYLLLRSVALSGGTNMNYSMTKGAPQGVPLPADALLKIQNLRQKAVEANTALQNNGRAPAPAPVPVENGVPQSADDVLKAP